MTATELTLYVHPASPSCMAVEMALKHCELAFIRIELNPQKPPTKAFLRRSPLARVPLLVDRRPGGEVCITEAPAILLYLSERFPDTELAMTDSTTKSMIVSWMSFFVQVFEKSVLQNSLNPAEIEVHLAGLNLYLSARAFLVGAYSMGDILATPFLDLLQQKSESFLTQFPNVLSWYKRLCARRCD